MPAQLNYLDWTLPGRQRKAELAEEYGIPVWVMEPLGGGSLASPLKKTALRCTGCVRRKAFRPGRLRFLQSLPNVVVTLSGMSNLTRCGTISVPLRREAAVCRRDGCSAVDCGGDDQKRPALYGMPLLDVSLSAESRCSMLLDLYNELRISYRRRFIAPMASKVCGETAGGMYPGCEAANKSVRSRLRSQKRWRIFSAMLRTMVIKMTVPPECDKISA